MAAKPKVDASSSEEEFEVEDSREKILAAIIEILAKSCENENWGLMEEAAEDYQKTYYKMRHALLPEVKYFSQDEKNILAKISAALYQKFSCLQRLASVEGLKSGVQQTMDTKKIHSALKSFAQGSLTLVAMESDLKECLNLPSSSSNTGVQEAEGSSTSGSVKNKISVRTFLHIPDDEYAEALQTAMGKSAGTLQLRKDVLDGYTYLNITIEKIELKNPESFIDPFISVSMKSLVGENIEDTQDTPIITDRDASSIIFGITVQIHRPIEEIPGGTAIFFELKHHKRKKSPISIKCFSFMEMDEIRPGRTCLEIYKKPTDYRRRRLSLLSAKPLYLHLFLSLDKTF